MFSKCSRFIIVAFFIIASGVSQAGLPNVDLPKLGGQIEESLREMFEHEEAMAMYKSIIEQTGVLAELGIDAKNNGWANVIVRTNQQKADVNKLKVTEQAIPAKNACGVLASISVSDLCFSLDVQAELEADDLLYDNTITSNNKEKAGISTKTKVDLTNAIVTRAMDSRPTFFKKSNSPADLDTDYNKPFLVNPRYLISSSWETLTLSPQDEVAIKDYIDLVAPPYVASNSAEDLSNINDSNLLMEMENKSYQAFPRQIFQKLLSKRMADTSGLSELQRLQMFSDEHFSTSSSNVMDTVSVKLSLSNLATPSVIWRNMVVTKAFHVNMALKKFKASLNQEAVEAISLGFRIRKAVR